jgi:hypothetical protein
MKYDEQPNVNHNSAIPRLFQTQGDLSDRHAFCAL